MPSTEGYEVLWLPVFLQLGASAWLSTKALSSKVPALCIICSVHYNLSVMTNMIRVLFFGYNLLVYFFVVGDSCQPRSSCAQLALRYVLY
jgi:hypothetical protein